MGRQKIKYDTSETPYQREFQDAMTPKVYLSSGFGGGKTYALMMKMFQLADLNRGCPGGILTPSYKMYKRDIIPTIRGICQDNGIRYRYNKSDMLWYFPDTSTYVYAFTSEDEDSIKGPNLGWFVVNEAPLCTEKSVMMALSRIRLKKAPHPCLALSGTPEGFNWVYDYFVRTPRKDTTLIFGDSRMNKHVAASYFSMLEDSYDPMMQKQYIGGHFVNLNGKAAAWSFNRFRHVAKGVKKVHGLPVWVSLDFNVSPMSATLWNRVPLGFDTGDRWRVPLRAFDEIKIESSNTYEVADAIIERCEKDSNGRLADDVWIFPDPAGRARSTKSMNLSDFDILVQKGFQRSQIKYKNVISVKDCLNAMNALFARNQIVIDEKCVETITDLERCVLKGNVFEIDKSDPKRTHWLDGIKNMIDYNFPIRHRSFRQERYR